MMRYGPLKDEAEITIQVSSRLDPLLLVIQHILSLNFAAVNQFVFLLPVGSDL